MQKLFSPIHPSRCFYACTWGIIIGIAVGVITEQTLNFSTIGLFIAIPLVIISLWRSRVIMLGVAFIAGMIISSCRLAPDLTSRDYISQITGETILITGQISEDPDSSDGNTALRLTNLKIAPTSVKSVENPVENFSTTTNSPEQTSIVLAGTMYVKISGNIDADRSDIVSLEGKLGAGFGTFVATMYRPKVVAIEQLTPGDVFVKFKNFFANLIHNFIPSPEADLGLGYLMGMKSGLSEDFSEALRIVGMTHVVVASGAHLGILVEAVRKVFGRLSKFAGLMFSLVAIFSFAMVVGFTPSMTRAALVSSLSILVGYVGRNFSPFRLLTFVAALTLLINPTHFLNLGWQLSFASFFGILIFAPRLTKVLYGGKNPPWLASMLITSFSTSLICAPVLIYNFGSLSLLSFVANLIILPTLPYVMLLVLLTGATSFLSVLANFIAKIATLLLDFHIFITEFLSEKTMFVLSLPTSNLLIYLLYLPVGIFIIYPQLVKISRRVLRPKSPPIAPQTREIIAENEEILYNDKYED